jgi:hypothetical protein
LTNAARWDRLHGGQLIEAVILTAKRLAALRYALRVWSLLTWAVKNSDDAPRRLRRCLRYCTMLMIAGRTANTPSV